VTATLTIQGGPRAGEEIEVTEELVIGRHGVDVTIDDGEMSRRHAALRPAGDAVEIEDLGSLNGTFVNDTRITEPTRLSHGDVVRIGQTNLAVTLDEAEAPAGGTVVSPRPQETIEQPRAPEAPAEPRVEPTPPAPPPPPEPRAEPAPPAPPPPAPAPAPPPARAPAQAAALPHFGHLSSAPPPRRGRAATRAVTAEILTFAAIIATAAALVVYFAQRA
jgi:predicted component of type VI protein secretion system